MDVRRMLDVKFVTPLLCKHHKLPFNLNIKPEHVRHKNSIRLKENVRLLFLSVGIKLHTVKTALGTTLTNT